MKHQTARAWLEGGRASPLPSEMSQAFDDYIDSLPWSGTTGLDWSRIQPARELKVTGKSPLEVYDWVRSTRAGSRSHMAIWYSRSEGGILVQVRDGAVAPDELYWDASGPRFAFSVEMANGVVHPFYADI